MASSSTKIAGLIEKVQHAYSWLPPRGCAGSVASTSYDLETLLVFRLNTRDLPRLQVSHYDKDERYMAVHDIANELSKVREHSCLLPNGRSCLHTRINDSLLMPSFGQVESLPVPCGCSPTAALV